MKDKIIDDLFALPSVRTIMKMNQIIINVYFQKIFHQYIINV